jgi:hypothetical protein
MRHPEADAFVSAAFNLEQNDLATPRQPDRHEVVTYVLGTFCHPCLRVGPRLAGWGGRTRTSEWRLSGSAKLSADEALDAEWALAEHWPSRTGG